MEYTFEMKLAPLYLILLSIGTASLAVKRFTSNEIGFSDSICIIHFFVLNCTTEH